MALIVLAPYPLTPHMAAAQASVPLLVTACAIGTCLAVIARSRASLLVCIGALGVIVLLGLSIRFDSRLTPPGPDASLVVSANMLYTNDNVAAVADDLLALQPDVLVTIETTNGVEAELASRLYDAPVARGKGASSGVLVWSNLPAQPLPSIVLPGRELPVVRVELPSGPVVLVGVHISSPTTSESLLRWRREWAALAPQLNALPAPVVVLGDFNTSHAHGPMRRLLAQYDSVAMGSLSSGTASTWPARPYSWWPFALPVLDIDHVLVRDLAAGSFRRFTITGSDHLGVSARIG